MDDLMSPQNLSPNQMSLAVFNSVRYLSDTTGMEAELVAVYNEASAVIRLALDLSEQPAAGQQLSLQ